MAMSTEDINRTIAQLESLGEQEVRRLLPLGQWGELESAMRTCVEDWLRANEATREAESIAVAREANAVAREANTLARSANSTAQEALRTARQQRTIAMIAIVIAAVSIIATIMTAIFISAPRP